MKTSDLMIGDWVKVYRNTNPVQVVLVDVDYIITDDEEDPVYDIDFEPIPITSEILGHNFEKYGQVYANLQQWVGRFGDKRKSIVQDIRTGEISIFDVWVKYVHELQHAMRLSGFTEEANKLKP